MTYLMSKLSALTAAFAELLPSQSVQDAKLCFIVTETVRRITGRFTKSSASRSLSNNPVGFLFKIFSVCPNGRSLLVLKELCPDAADADFDLCNTVRVHHGTASAEDLDCLIYNGEYRVGELQASFSVGCNQRSILSFWEFAPVRDLDNGIASFMATHRKENVATSR